MSDLRDFLEAAAIEIEAGQAKPTHIVTAVQLPTGAIELAVNTQYIPEKVKYILGAYDKQMRLKTNPSIVMKSIMLV